MGDLLSLIREKKAEFDELSKRVAVLRKELEEARALLADERQARRSSNRRKTKRPSDPVVKADSSGGYALEVLQRVGHPMHARDLVRLIGEIGHKVKQTTLVGQLTRYVNKNQIFSRPKPNTFGLREWESEDTLRLPWDEEKK